MAVSPSCRSDSWRMKRVVSPSTGFDMGCVKGSADTGLADAAGDTTVAAAGAFFPGCAAAVLVTASRFVCFAAMKQGKVRRARQGRKQIQSIPVIPRQIEVIKQLQNRTNQRGDVSKRGGIQHTGHAGAFG